MLELKERIKKYFTKKVNNETAGAAPEGMCPTCWGHSEWDGQYYTVVKDKHLVPDGDVYDSFISKIVDKHVNTTHKHEHQYICTTCDEPITA